MAVIELNFLGYPKISINGQQIQQDIPDKATALLCYLAITGQTHRRDSLAGMFWGNKREQRARNSLSIVLNKLRKFDALQEQLQVTRREVGLADPSIVCDVLQFCELALHPAQHSLAQLEAAALLYGGSFLNGFRPNDDDGSRDFHDWARQQQARLEQIALALFNTLVERFRESDDMSKAIIYAQRILAIDPLMESAHRDLMTLFAQNGQSELAIAQYQTCCQILNDELEIEPDSSTKALYEKIVASRNANDIFEKQAIASEETLFDRLPLRPYDILFGRKDALTELIDHISVKPDSWLTNLFGIGGLGKSSLSYMAVQQLIEQDKIQQLAWVEIEGQPVSAELLSSSDLFANIIHKLITQMPSISSPAPTHAQRLRQVRKQLHTSPWLIVIDNIERFEDDGSLSELLFSLANPSRILIISRVRIQATRPIRPLPLAPINANAAKTCVRTRASHLGQNDLADASDSLLDRLYTLVGGHPQALLLFVKTANYISAEEILYQFERAEVQTIEAFYNNIYSRVWAIQSIDAQQLLDAMRLSPVQGMPEPYLAHICHLTRNSYWRAVSTLNDVALLLKGSQAGVTHQHIHSLTGSFLNSLDHQGQRSNEARQWQIEQITTACNWWLPQIESMDGGSFEAAHPYLLKLIKMGSSRPETALISAELAAALKMPVYMSSYWRQWLPIYDQSLTDIPTGENRLKMTLLSSAGLLHTRAYNTDNAIPLHRQALTIAAELGAVQELARHNVNLSISYRIARNLDFSLRHAQTAVDIVDELHLDGPIAIAALNARASIAYEMALFEEVCTYSQRALALQTEALPILSFVYTNWGIALIDLSHFDQAKEKFELAFNIAKQHGSYAGMIVSTIGLCAYYLETGDLEATHSIIKSKLFDRQSEKASPYQAAHMAEYSGRYYLLKNEIYKATSLFEEAIPLWEEANCFTEIGRTYALLARAHNLSGEHDKSIAYQSKAEEIFANGGVWGALNSKRFPTPALNDR